MSAATDDTSLTEFEDLLRALDADALDHLGSLLRERARRRRVQITLDEAEHAVQSASLSPTWLPSRLADVGRVRAAARLFLERGHHPDQVRSPLIAVALDFVPHPLIAPAAVDAGIGDAERATKGASVWSE